MGKTRITNESYDEHLSFSLPKGYYTARVVDDDGEQNFQIRAGETTDSEGNKVPKFAANVTFQEESSTTNSDAGIVLNGNFVNRIIGGSREMSLGPINITIYIIGIGIDYNGSVYTISAQRAGISSVDDWIEFLDTVIQSVRIDGEPGSFERFTPELFESACESHDEIDDYGYPKATPDAGQHEHLDFLTKSKSKMSLLGGMLTVNATGTEYSFYKLSEVFDDDDDSARAKAIRTITNKGTSPFPLAEKAHQMSHIFRVSPDFFDTGHDRENEIDSGLIQRALTYNQFRSFAWTLTAYCEENGVEPEDVSYDELEGITAFIEKRNGLNYKGDSYSPVLCSGNDIHVYYVPDSISDSTKKHLLDNDEDDNIAERVRSLDGLRKELEYLYPAMQTICNQLVKEREVEEPLVGGTADILYAWCSMTYAAREPIYTEDGPVNCMWEPPGSELRWQEELIKNEVVRKKTWLLDHKKDLDTKTRITVKDKLFVFSGVEYLEEWEKIHNELIRQGGVYRTAVSGKTDYLVCNPADTGESKVKKALEQKSKGSGIKIILLEDLLKELGLQLSTDPETRLKEIQSQYVTTGKNIKKPEREPDLSIIQREAFTYNDHQIARGDGYSFDIPDGFVIKKKVEDRDFVAYIPTEDDPEDYDQSRFVIFAIEKTENEAFKKFRIPLEYWSVFTDFKRALTQDFEKTIKENYYRKDLPGVILFGHDPGVLHVMLMLYIKDHIQMFRLIINGVDRKERYGYECLVKSLLEHVHADEPAPTLKALDDIKFLNAELSSNISKEWTQCAVDYLNHIDSAKMIMRNQLLQGFQSDQQERKADVTKFKVDIKKMLKTCSEYTDEVLKHATAFYLLKRIEDPNNKLLKNIKDSILKIADVADQSIKMNEQELKVESAFAEKVRNNIDKNADEFLLDLLQVYKDGDKATYINRLITELDLSVTPSNEISRNRSEVSLDHLDRDGNAPEAKRKPQKNKTEGADISRSVSQTAVKRTTASKEASSDTKKETAYRKAIKNLEQDTLDSVKEAVAVFKELDTYKDSKEQLKEARKRVKYLREQEKKEEYISALEKMNSDDILDLKSALEIFEKLDDYKDSVEKRSTVRYKVLVAEKQEEDRKDRVYKEALQLSEDTDSMQSLKRAEVLLKSLSGNKKADSLRRKVSKEIKQLSTYNQAVELAKDDTLKSLQKAVKLLEPLGKFRDSSELVIEYKKKIEDIMHEMSYVMALKLAEYNSIPELNEAIKRFTDLNEYKDSSVRLEKVRVRVTELEEKAEQERLERERKAAEEKALAEKKRKAARTKKTIIVLFILAAVAALFYYMSVILPKQKYETAAMHMEKGEYAEAAEILSGMRDYQDCAELLNRCNQEIAYEQAKTYLENGEYELAIEGFKELDGFKDSKHMVDVCHAENLLDSSKTLYDRQDYSSSIELIRNVRAYHLAEYDEILDQFLSEIVISAAENKKYKDASDAMDEMQDKTLIDPELDKEIQDAVAVIKAEEERKAQLQRIEDGYQELMSMSVGNEDQIKRADELIQLVSGTKNISTYVYTYNFFKPYIGGYKATASTLWISYSFTDNQGHIRGYGSGIALNYGSLSGNNSYLHPNSYEIYNVVSTQRVDVTEVRPARNFYTTFTKLK